MNPSTPWMRVVWELARLSVEKRWTLVSGEGLPWLDFAVWAFRESGGEVEIVPASGGKSSWPRRDAEVIAQADAVIPVAVRADGIMARLLASLVGVKPILIPNAAIQHDLIDVDHAALRAEEFDLRVEFPRAPRAASIKEFEPTPAGYLWHFTRALPGPWPGQTAEEYFRALVDAAPGADHSASAVLDRIFAEKKIRACGKLIRGAYPVVCFTERNPAELLELRRYRPALLRWDFEPCAVGIPIGEAERIGIRPVLYRAPAAFSTLPPAERYLYQKHDPPRVDFTHEAEWRNLGDVDLSTIEGLFVYRGGGECQ